MLSMDPDKVCFVIIRARELEELELIEGREESDEGIDLDHEEAFDQLDGHEPNDEPYGEELTCFIAQLSEDEQIELVALAWLGRGDYDKDDWAEALTAARERHNERTAGYLLGMPMLSDYLEEGLAAFELSCADFDDARL